MADDVAGQHCGNEIVIKMQIGAADGAARYLYDGITRMLDLGIRNPVVSYVFLAMPDQRVHRLSSPRTYSQANSRVLFFVPKFSASGVHTSSLGQAMEFDDGSVTQRASD
jgi:hypothetical protein